MTPDEYVAALEALGYSPEIARIPIPEIHEGDDAEARDYHLVHQDDGRVAIGLPSDRSNKTWIVTWNDVPAVFATADEARAVIIELITRKKAIYGG
jgi:hypothetical protein